MRRFAILLSLLLTTACATQLPATVGIPAAADSTRLLHNEVQRAVDCQAQMGCGNYVAADGGINADPGGLGWWFSGRAGASRQRGVYQAPPAMAPHGYRGGWGYRPPSRQPYYYDYDRRRW